MSHRFLPAFMLFISLLCGPSLQAQLSKGTLYLGSYFNRNNAAVQSDWGSLSLNAFQDSSFLEFSLSPEVAIFLSDRIMVGGRFLYGMATDFESSGSAVGLNPLARYYLNPKANNTHFFGQASLGATFQLTENGSALFQSQLGVGMTHFIAPGIGLDVALTFEDPDFESSHDGSLALSTRLNIYLDRNSRANHQTVVSGITRGTWMLGGTTSNFRLSTAALRASNDPSYAFTINPSALYFVGNRLGIGAAFSVGMSGSSDLFKIRTIGIAPQLRYYLSPQQRTQWFVGTGFSMQSVKADLFDLKYEAESTNIFLGGGVNSFITPNLAFELGPNLNYDVEQGTLTPCINLGLQFFLNPRSRE